MRQHQPNLSRHLNSSPLYFRVPILPIRPICLLHLNSNLSDGVFPICLVSICPTQLNSHLSEGIIPISLPVPDSDLSDEFLVQLGLGVVHGVRDEVDPVLGRIVLQHGHHIARSSVSVTFKMLVIVIMRGKIARCTTTVFLSVSVSVPVRNITFLENKSIVPIGSKVYF